MDEAPSPLPPSPLLGASGVELFCPTCGYNLSGTTEERCSECGEPFDRVALIQWTTAPVQPLPFGPLPRGLDDHVFRLSLFAPSRLGRLFPPRPSTEDAGRYSIAMRLGASVGVPFVLVIMAMAALHGNGEAFFVLFMIPAPVIIGSVACEVVVAALLARFVLARSVAAGEQYFFWRNLCRCFAGHLLVNAILLGLCLGAMLFLIFYIEEHSLGGMRGYQMFAIVWFLPFLGPLVAVLWWWNGLGRAIVARGAPGAGRTAVIILIPFIGLAAMILGLLLGMLEGYLVATVCFGARGGF